ncbi:hypothetical protein WA026_007762 [Henosepilachna vigintioctopunctata]|uniref:Phospholipid/glycerol acyltransferase domain-containing protein n=1 Tax=Henosepilachna vigintioctopunctata TaxID=420089 RepID=A0AAW1U3Z0_9CUCU
MNLNDYEDILEPRRFDLSHFFWCSKKLNSVIAYKQNIKPTPSLLKEAVLNDPKIQKFLEEISREKRIPKDFLDAQVRLILDEIGYQKNLKIIRLLGLVLVKICLKVCEGIFVNHNSISHIKSVMGSCPVIFVPSHRSYADFILMSLICFTYDIEIPAIAAGMDFHGMWAMGSILRDTGAFFMRRSYNNDTLYWTTFKQYVYQLVTKGDLPIEFFIEGTRSRSNKSMMPKYGLLNMILKPLFLRQVPDIIFVPINISYEKIMEEKLFSFELLGVPKPKESTSAFFKSLSIIKENYGSIHMTFGKPLCSKQFFGEYLDTSRRSTGPIHEQELTERDKSMIPSLSHEIIYIQQKMTTLYVMNLIALLTNHNLTKDEELLSYDELKEKILWLKMILEKFDANIWSTDIDSDIKKAFEVHKNIIHLTGNRKIDIVKDHVNLANIDITKLKGYHLSEKVMTQSVPFVMLYIYINPILHCIVDAALIVIILKMYANSTSDSIFQRYHFLRNLFLYDFVTYYTRIPLDFQKAVNICTNFKLIQINSDGKYNLCENQQNLVEIFISSIEPFLYSYFTTLQILETYNRCDEKRILVEVQEKIVFEMEHKFIHPYSLNLDSIAHCLSSLVLSASIKRVRGDNGVAYEIDRTKVSMVKNTLEPYILKPHLGKTIHNNVLRNKL